MDIVDPVDFVVLGLATWRLTSLVVKEDGPWNLLARLRHLIGVRFDAASQPYGLNIVAEALTCMWCSSVWVGVAFSLSYLTFPEPTRLVGFPLALSAAALVLQRLVTNEPG
jgi:hypothetical protein